jgi:uncharacterized protein YraI
MILNWKSPVRILLIVVALLACVFSGAAQPDEPVTGQTYQTTNLRIAPDTRFEIVGQVGSGVVVTLVGIDETRRWLLVETDAGLSGWTLAYTLIVDVALETLPVVSESEAPADPDGDVLVTAYGRVNVRSAPDITAETLFQIDTGTTALAIARCCDTNDWLLIRLSTTAAEPLPEATPEADEADVLVGVLEGWVAYFTVEVTGAVDDLPLLVPGEADPEDLVPPSDYARSRFNARVRPAPTLESDTLVIVPFATLVQVLGRDDTGGWLYVAYDGISGWVSAPLIELTAAQISALDVIQE